MKRQENRDIRDSGAKQLFTVIREEQAEEAGMGNNAVTACQEAQLDYVGK